MEVQIVSVDKTTPGFTSVCLRCGDRELQTIISSCTVKVYVNREGYRANLTGKSFASTDEALEHYTHPATRAMLRASISSAETVDE